MDTKVSRVYVKVLPDGRGHAHGVMGRFASGRGLLGARDKIGELVIDLTSFAADDPEARRYVGLEENVSERERRNVTHTMLGPNVLDTAQYLTATFTVTSITPLDKQRPGEPGNYQVEGKLDFHGVSGPIRFQAKAERTEMKEAFRVRGQFLLVQTRYGITPYSALFGAVKVKDELRVYGDVILVPKRPSEPEERQFRPQQHAVAAAA